MMNIAKPWITLPAAAVPECPSPIINLVEETFSDNRSIKDANKIVGNAEKSNGRFRNKVTVKIKIAIAKDAAKPISSTQDGIGKIIITMIAISASASKTVG
jgi:hypothetical protein